MLSPSQSGEAVYGTGKFVLQWISARRRMNDFLVTEYFWWYFQTAFFSLELQ